MLKSALLAAFAVGALSTAAVAMPVAAVDGASDASVIQVRGVCDARGRCFNTGGHGNDVYRTRRGYAYGFRAHRRPFYRARRYYR